MKRHVYVYALISVLIAGLASCAKVSNNADPNTFAGTWSGTITCSATGSYPDTVVITVDGSAISIPGTVGAGTCVKTVAFTASVKNDHIEFPMQANADACGNTHIMSGSAYVYQNQITLSESVSGPILNTTCSFVGSKQ